METKRDLDYELKQALGQVNTILTNSKLLVWTQQKLLITNLIKHIMMDFRLETLIQAALLKRLHENQFHLKIPKSLKVNAIYSVPITIKCNIFPKSIKTSRTDKVLALLSINYYPRLFILKVLNMRLERYSNK